MPCMITFRRYFMKAFQTDEATDADWDQPRM